jgi:predicted acetyltransferase
MLYQLHWQNRDNLEETEFIAQCDHTVDFEAWLKDLLERRRSEMPEGWQPLVCTQDSQYFAWSDNS